MPFEARSSFSRTVIPSSAATLASRGAICLFVMCPWLLLTSSWMERKVDSIVAIREETDANINVTVAKLESICVICEVTNSILEETVNRTLEKTLMLLWVTKEEPLTWVTVALAVSVAPTLAVPAGGA